MLLHDTNFIRLTPIERRLGHEESPAPSKKGKVPSAGKPINTGPSTKAKVVVPLPVSCNGVEQTHGGLGPEDHMVNSHVSSREIVMRSVYPLWSRIA